MCRKGSAGEVFSPRYTSDSEVCSKSVCLICWIYSTEKTKSMIVTKS